MNPYIKDFIRYLKQNGLYPQFRNNFYSYEKSEQHYSSEEWKNIRKAIFYTKNNCSFAAFAHFGFIWYYTPERENIWEDLEQKLEKQYKRGWNDYEKKV